MGNSTVSLQDVVDYSRTIGDLMASPPVGGFTNFLALQVANDVMSDMLAQRFNWKFNRIVVAPFYTISWQQDYATINTKNIGWLEHVSAVDINNTALPKPLYWPEAVRDLERTSNQFGKPGKVCWLPNDQMVQGVWPGIGQTYTNPVGTTQTPFNPPTNIIDVNGNILILTTYGVTGAVAPSLAAASAAGATVNDGTCIWTCADPKAQGFRLSPLPPQQGVTYQINVTAQARPLRFTTLSQKLDPIPDDYEKYFKEGYIAYLHRHSTAPVVRNRFPAMQQGWFAQMADARGQGDRERDDAGFVPSTSIMGSESIVGPIGPAWPYQY